MVYYVLYEEASGRPVSMGTVVANPLPEGLAVLELQDRPPDGQMWDNATHAFVARPPKVLIDRLDDLRDSPAFDDLRQAMQSLTLAQRNAIRVAIGRLLGRHRYRSAGESPETL